MENKSVLLLNLLLNEKKQKNPLYSLTALARDLEVSQPQLTRILKGKRRLSPKIALRLGKMLNLRNDTLLDLLISVIEYEEA
jgi:plasmid maintenance system antidote protein VapI